MLDQKSGSSLLHRSADPEADPLRADARVTLAGGLLELLSSTPGHPGHKENVSVSVYFVIPRGYSPDLSAPFNAQVPGLEVQDASIGPESNIMEEDVQVCF